MIMMSLFFVVVALVFIGFLVFSKYETKWMKQKDENLDADSGSGRDSESR